MNNRVVKVRWADATHIEDDMTETKLISQKLAECTTVGMVVVDNEQRLTIAAVMMRKKRFIETA